ncbi:MAG: ABC transporter ATP-binding protein [Planctomycetes bacterium]|nr:ABC transporter ATP-binding protein [Planctomycetota bacterium]
MSFIELSRVTKTYRRAGHVVSPLVEVDLVVEQGEFFVLLGPSGSGKSTLLNLLAGIDRVDSGRIVVGGRDLSALGPGALADWRAENVGYIFQQHNLVPVLTAYENVELPLGLLPLGRADRHERVALALEAVGLGDRHDHLPRQLSGGQEQRVAIARAIVADPPLLVADEPTGNLDADSADAVLTLLQRINRERGATIVMVTHDPRAARRGSRAMRLDKGSLRHFDHEEAGA